MAIQTEQLDKSYFAGEREDGYDVIGTPVQRSDARGHVTGRTEFFEDVQPPGTAAPEDAPLRPPPRAAQATST